MRSRIFGARRALPTPRLTAGVIIAGLLAAAGLEALPGAAASAGYVVLPWPRCTPLCAHTLSHGPRIAAIYLAMHKDAHSATVTIDAFTAGIPGRSVTGRLCYEAHRNPAEPGCVVIATTHGRRVGAGVWWLRFRAPVYERYQISNSSSHVLVSSYWFGVSVPVEDTSAQAPARVSSISAMSPERHPSPSSSISARTLVDSALGPRDECLRTQNVSRETEEFADRHGQQNGPDSDRSVAVHANRERLAAPIRTAPRP